MIMGNINTLLLFFAILLLYELSWISCIKSIRYFENKKPKFNILMVILSQLFMLLAVILYELWRNG